MRTDAEIVDAIHVLRTACRITTERETKQAIANLLTAFEWVRGKDGHPDAAAAFKQLLAGFDALNVGYEAQNTHRGMES